MTEEKKDDLNEQQTFLNGHEDLLKSINEKEDASDEQTDPAEEAPVVEPVVEEKPVAKEEISETVAEEVPVIAEGEPEPAVEAPDTEPLPKTQRPVGIGKKKKKKIPQQHPRHSPQHEELLKQQALEQQEVKEVLVFFRKYAKPAAIAIVVVCAIVLADKFFKSQRYKKEAAADTALMNAQGTADLQGIIDDYASTPTAPLALMELAREKFNAGQFDEAKELYSRFAKKHGGHELAVQAELNLITCKEAEDQFGEAHLLYGEFAKKHAGSYLAPSAMMSQARCLEALSQLDEAQIAYEDIIVNFPETSWSRIAEANLKTVLGKKQ